LLIELPARREGTDPRIAAAVQEMEKEFFGNGLNFIDGVELASAEVRP
jgi:hypothetical protein